MLTEHGKVVAIDGVSIWVETLRQSSCSSCSARAGCGHGIINSAMPGTSRAVVKALLSPDMSPPPKLHDTVELSLPERRFLYAVAVLYLLPMLLGVGFAIAANQLVQPMELRQGAVDFWTLMATASGIAVGLLVARRLNAKVGQSSLWQPRVTSITAGAVSEAFSSSTGTDAASV